MLHLRRKASSATLTTVEPLLGAARHAWSPENDGTSSELTIGAAAALYLGPLGTISYLCSKLLKSLILLYVSKVLATLFPKDQIPVIAC